jgi:thioredoxin reductase
MADTEKKQNFDIPLYLSSKTTGIFGNDCVGGIEVTSMEKGVLVSEKSFHIDCDTVLLSVGHVPENELSRAVGAELNAVTNGPVVDSSLMTNIDGVFTCGNDGFSPRKIRRCRIFGMEGIEN